MKINLSLVLLFVAGTAMVPGVLTAHGEEAINSSILSPRAQMAGNIVAEDVACRDGLQLMMRDDGDAICVFEQTVQMFVDRGLATKAETLDGGSTYQLMSDAVSTTTKSLALYDEHGEDAFDIITALNVEENTYPFVITADTAVEMADGSILDRRGMSVWSDIELEAAVGGVMDILDRGNGAWITYVFLNPATEMDQAKMTWIIQRDGYIFGSGFYLEGQKAESVGSDWSIKKAIAAYEQMGVDEAFTSINMMESDMGNYPFVIDMDGIVVAHGAIPSHVGDQSAISESGGWEEILAELSRSGRTTASYDFANPATGNVEPKQSILVLHDGYIFGSGHYTAEKRHDDTADDMMEEEEEGEKKEEKEITDPGESMPTEKDSTDGDMMTEEVQMVREQVQDAMSIFDANGGGETGLNAISQMFITGEFYPFVLDTDGLVVAHGSDPASYVGTLDIMSLDIDKSIEQIGADMAEDGESWVTYGFNNPATNKTQEKHSLLVEHSGYWFGSGYYTETNSTAMPEIGFTEEEMAWIQGNPTVRVAYDPGWPPIEYIDESGQLAGVSARYVQIFKDATGIDFVTVEISDWSDALNAIKDGRADIIPSLKDTEPRRQFMDFTTPHTTITANIITIGEEEYTAEDLESLTVGTPKDNAVETWLNENHPDVEYMSFDTALSALESMDEGDIDVFLDSWATTSYIAAENDIEDVYNAGQLDEGFVLSVGVAKDQQVLGGILQRILDSIPEEDKEAMVSDAIG